MPGGGIIATNSLTIHRMNDFFVLQMQQHGQTSTIMSISANPKGIKYMYFNLIEHLHQ
jgi:D-alanyl-lipoteichoic acid acyltransferase DltB (MBOAT superfamily)